MVNTIQIPPAPRNSSLTLRVVVMEDQVDGPRLEDLDAVVGPIVEYHLAEDGEVVGLGRSELIQIMGMAEDAALLLGSSRRLTVENIPA